MTGRACFPNLLEKDDEISKQFTSTASIDTR